MNSRGPKSRVPSPPLAARPADAMKGPKRAAGGILLFFASSILAVHLAYDGDASFSPAAPSALAEAAIASAPPAGATLPTKGPAPGTVPPVPTAVAFVEPAAAAAPGARDRDLNACIERIVSAVAEPKPTAPGRWPAIKRAREELRLKRLAARTDCERQLAL